MPSAKAGYLHGDTCRRVILEADTAAELDRVERHFKRSSEQHIKAFQVSKTNTQDGYVLFQDVIYCVYAVNGFVDKIKGEKAREIKKKILSAPIDTVDTQIP